MTVTLMSNELLQAALTGYQVRLGQIETEMSRIRATIGQTTDGAAPVKRGTAAETVVKPAKRRKMSAAARKRIALAQKKRWSDYHRLQGTKKHTE